MKTRAKGILGILGSLLILVLVFFAARWLMLVYEGWSKLGGESWSTRKPRFKKAAETGMTVVDAINRYVADHGAPPPNLEALIPEYLPEIPHTGLHDYPTFKYCVFANPKESLVWYDLGSRKGKPMAGLWVYTEGKPDHAILALTLDQNDRVVEGSVDRMPQEYEPIDFDADKWRRHESRIEMVRSLPEHVPLKGVTLAEVKAALGEPTGIRTVRNSPWELWIDCPNGVLNFDSFFYWPTQDYPKHYGGTVVLVGKWAYVFE